MMDDCKNNYETKEEFDDKFMKDSSESRNCANCSHFVEDGGIYYCDKFND